MRIHLVIFLVPFVSTNCTTTEGYRHADQTITVSRHGIFARTTPMNYWIVGAKPGQVTHADNLSVYRKTLQRGESATPIKCTGFVDTTRSSRIEVRLAEKHGGTWQQAGVNGAHKLIDETVPKPFYHWLIP